MPTPFRLIPVMRLLVVLVVLAGCYNTPHEGDVVSRTDSTATVWVGGHMHSCTGADRYIRSDTGWTEVDARWRETPSYVEGRFFSNTGECHVVTCEPRDSVRVSLLRLRDTEERRSIPPRWAVDWPGADTLTVPVFEPERVETDLRVVIPAFSDSACNVRRDVVVVVRPRATRREPSRGA